MGNVFDDDSEANCFCGQTLQKHNMVRYIVWEAECYFPTSEQMNDEWWRMRGRERAKAEEGEAKEK